MDLYAPIKIIEIDVEHEFSSIKLGHSPESIAYTGALCLIRKGPKILGSLVLKPQDGEISKLHIEAALRQITAQIQTSDSNSGEVPASPASVIIATRNRMESLLRCVDALLQQDHPNFEIIVVDNAPSDDRTERAIAEHYSHIGHVRYLREARPGLATAHNAGVRAARHPILAFTDDDVIADKHWLSSLCDAFARFPGAGCVTGLIMPAELETRAQVWADCHGGFAKGFATQVFDLTDNRRLGPLYPLTAGQFGSGANMAFTADALIKIGCFDERLGAGTSTRGGDDLDSFFRVISSGYQIVYEPQAMIWHFHRREDDGMARQAFGYGMGLGAYLMKCAVSDRRNLWKFTRGLGAGMNHMFGRKADRNKRLPPDFPKTLRWNEKKGIAFGVLAYLRSGGQAGGESSVNTEHTTGKHVVWRA